MVFTNCRDNRFVRFRTNRDDAMASFPNRMRTPGLAMSQGYSFAIHSNSPGALGELLGDLAMRDDADAIDFAKQVIVDLIAAGPHAYEGHVMEISRAGLIVASLPFA